MWSIITHTLIVMMPPVSWDECAVAATSSYGTVLRTAGIVLKSKHRVVLPWCTAMYVHARYSAVCQWIVLLCPGQGAMTGEPLQFRPLNAATCGTIFVSLKAPAHGSKSVQFATAAYASEVRCLSPLLGLKRRQNRAKDDTNQARAISYSKVQSASSSLVYPLRKRLAHRTKHRWSLSDEGSLSSIG